ncbi:hypothetical protein B1R32_1264 [Abditibacterium utsteinense]|uniref:Uncharacterized protein n=1 Tax=Abditibacterium utsteinense TaxID=1960156 RepID=A0A2S8SP99_9BACT|nr:hypothetical protein [Abditibacterium utsteinense]PQV62620.1 hypothetical protein B1R32_1264 [Abditibacterium utsteinense]
MKRLLLATLLGASLWAAPSLEARPRQTAKAKRLSVLDYYYLLPFIGTGGNTTRRQRLQLLQRKNKPVIDLHHDYLTVKPDASPVEQITVFRSGNTALVAQSVPDFHSDYNGFMLYRLQNGKLRDVTKQVLPVSVQRDRFLYQLPRVGTTIHVFSFNLDTQSRKPAFDLLWRRGRFVKRNLPSPKR